MPKPLIGHQQVQRQIATLLDNGRFPHALLLHGPRGIGKRLLADHLVHRLICGPSRGAALLRESEGPLAHDASSPQAAQLEAGSCPDYHLLAPEEGKKSIAIKQVREVLESLQRSADTARVVLVDALEDLLPEAANTILKTLEEPRPGICFLLVSHQVSAVLPTIRSRCRLMPVRPLQTAEVAAVLEDHQLNPGLAPLAQGAPGNLVGPGGAARRKLLETLNAGQLPPFNTEGLLPVLLAHLAQKKPTLKTAETYFKIAKLHRKHQDMNLPLAQVNEAALALYADR